MHLPHRGNGPAEGTWLDGQDASLRRMARRIGGRWQLDEDLVQETWVSALRRPAHEVHELEAWIRRTLDYRAFRLLSREAERRSRERVSARPERQPSVLEELERGTTVEYVRDAVDGLREPYRSVVRLHWLEEIPLHEIARRFDRPARRSART